MKNVFRSLAKSVLIPLGFAVASAANTENYSKYISGLGTTSSVISNKEMENILKIVKFLNEPGLLIEALLKQLKQKNKNKRVDFLACY